MPEHVITERQTAYYRRVVKFLMLKNGLGSLYKKDEWLWIFLQTNVKTKSSLEIATIFKPAKIEFEKRPIETVELLEHFAKDLATQELTRRFLVTLADQSDDHRECWLFIQSALQIYLKVSETISSTVDDRRGKKDSSDLIDRFQQQTTLSKDYKEAAQQICDFATQQQYRYDDTIWRCLEPMSNPLTQKLTGIVKAASETWPHGSQWIQQTLGYLADGGFADFLDKPTRDQEEWFPLSIQLSANLGVFAELITGCPGIFNRQVALSMLRQAGDDKKQQWGIFYETIEKLRSEIAEKQQIITCVGYRHVLEKLPNVTKLATVFPRASLSAATPIWKLAWQLIVEVELHSMLQVHVNKIHPGTFSAPTPEPKESERRWYLRRLLERDFTYWASKNRKTIGTNLVSIQSAGISITAEAHPAPFDATNFTILFRTLDLKYREWQVYQRGLGMFSELSNSIHEYDKLFEVDETNWAKSDCLILNYLTPRPDKTKETIVWGDKWTDRGLPT